MCFMWVESKVSYTKSSIYRHFIFFQPHPISRYDAICINKIDDYCSEDFCTLTVLSLCNILQFIDEIRLKIVRYPFTDKYSTEEYELLNCFCG